MFVVMKNGAVWGYYDTQAEAIAAIEEERGKEDGVELVMIHEEDGTTEEGEEDGRDL